MWIEDLCFWIPDLEVLLAGCWESGHLWISFIFLSYIHIYIYVCIYMRRER